MARIIERQEEEKIYIQSELETALRRLAKAIIKAFRDGIEYQEKSERPF